MSFVLWDLFQGNLRCPLTRRGWPRAGRSHPPRSCSEPRLPVFKVIIYYPDWLLWYCFRGIRFSTRVESKAKRSLPASSCAICPVDGSPALTGAATDRCSSATTAFVSGLSARCWATTSDAATSRSLLTADDVDGGCSSDVGGSIRFCCAVAGLWLCGFASGGWAGVSSSLVSDFPFRMSALLPVVLHGFVFNGTSHKKFMGWRPYPGLPAALAGSDGPFEFRLFP